MNTLLVLLLATALAQQQPPIEVRARAMAESVMSHLGSNLAFNMDDSVALQRRHTVMLSQEYVGDPGAAIAVAEALIVAVQFSDYRFVAAVPDVSEFEPWRIIAVRPGISITWADSSLSDSSDIAVNLHTVHRRHP